MKLDGDWPPLFYQHLFPEVTQTNAFYPFKTACLLHVDFLFG